MAKNLPTCDLVILGGGPAGITGAITAAASGKSVALVDNHHEPGGAGINTGTVPSKTLRETALTLAGARSRDLYGIDLSLKRDATVADFLRHERAVKVSMNSLLSRRLANSRAELFNGAGVFEDSHTILVQTAGQTAQRIRGAHILIATGSSPVRPAIFPFKTPGIYDSDTILELTRLPKTLAVVGAGTIGCEYACIFAALHTKVHIVDGRRAVFPFIDREIADVLTTAMMRHGVRFHWNERVQSCRTSESGGVVLTLSSGASLCTEAALVAAGRKSNTDNLNLAAAGVPVGDRGLIGVNEHFQTSVPHVYAAGDVIGPPALASTSMQQARHAIRHAF
ncbi:MAG TPA: FAD-dependent oxidoreductase, partial [Bryobacteraceae bacterium]|nr:FAD-dependent oxidoreductase [Bryobacteraceae bacterium]